jgi:hypothetical protein
MVCGCSHFEIELNNYVSYDVQLQCGYGNELPYYWIFDPAPHWVHALAVSTRRWICFRNQQVWIHTCFHYAIKIFISNRNHLACSKLCDNKRAAQIFRRKTKPADVSVKIEQDEQEHRILQNETSMVKSERPHKSRKRSREDRWFVEVVKNFVWMQECCWMVFRKLSKGWYAGQAHLCGGSNVFLQVMFG